MRDPEGATTAREKLAFGLAIAAIVVVPGLSAAVINALGYSTLGTIVWVLGYGSGILTVWYVWIRPLDLRAPTSDVGEDPERDG